MDVQRQMLLFETTAPPQGVASVWEMLDDQQRAEVTAAMAQVIAKAAYQLLGLEVIGQERGDDD